MQKVGFIGWRGMVGSVLMDRMIEEKDFSYCEPIFFTTSQKGQKGPDIGKEIPLLKDAYDLQELSKMDIIITCQGGDYTKKIFSNLRQGGWEGYWIDAASTLRMDDQSIICLDPINLSQIEKGLKNGVKNYIGGNCTVSLLLMAIGGLFKSDLVEWVSTMTYQAASGAGAKNMRELISQMAAISDSTISLVNDPSSSTLDIDRKVTQALQSDSFPKELFQAPLAGSLLPWIDTPMENGQTREEWKGYVEANKILESDPKIPVDGICVRISSMRCHSQALTIKLKKDISIEEIEGIIQSSNDWVKTIPNNKNETISELSPAKVGGTLAIPVGRIRKMNLGPKYVTAFTVGDQLLWGAAEPLRRIFKIILERG